MTAKILKEFKQDIDEYVLEPSSGGVFELLKDGELIYSKKETGEFPEEDKLLENLKT